MCIHVQCHYHIMSYATCTCNCLYTSAFNREYCTVCNYFIQLWGNYDQVANLLPLLPSPPPPPPPPPPLLSSPYSSTPIPHPIIFSLTVDQALQRWHSCISVFAHVFLAEGPGSERDNFLNARAGFASRMARYM